jgi:hypothetical protein
MERARAGAVPTGIREGEQARLNVRLIRQRPFVQGRSELSPLASRYGR